MAPDFIFRLCAAPVLAAVSLFVSGCGRDSAASRSAEGGAFRVRSDFAASLNADGGWAGAVNEGVTVAADRPFRVRFEVERAAEAAARHRLQYRRNGGEWARVEVHDFPYPKAELELDFAAMPAGVQPEGWSIVQGRAAGVEVAADGAEKFLRVQAGREPVTGLYLPPWESEEIEVATKIRIPTGNPRGVALVFGYVDTLNFGRVLIDVAEGSLRTSRWVDGRETAIDERRAPVVAGRWLDLAVQYRGSTVEVNFGDDAVEFAVEFGAPIPFGPVGFHVLTDGTAEFREFELAGEPKSPRVSIVSCAALASGGPTIDLLRGSALPFAEGAGLSLVEKTPASTGAGSHTEFEWALVVRRFADRAETNEEGDRIELRVVDVDTGDPVSARSAELRLTIPPGHLGGTFVEAPGRIGPWQARNGDLYFVMEPAESSNVFMVVKSSDGGRTWREADGANRPRTDDLEAVDGRQIGDTIQFLHQVTKKSVRHAFRTSDHPTAPDTWEVRDEQAATADSFAQAASLTVRSDGSMVAFHVGQARIHMAVRSVAGVWSDAGVIDVDVAGPSAVVARDDVIHLAYYGLDGTLWHRRVFPDGTRSERQKLAEGAGVSRSVYGAVLPLVYLPESDRVAMVYRLADGFLWERRASADGALTEPVRVSDRPVVTNAVDSQQPGADVVAEAGGLHVLFIDEETRSIFSTHDRGGWQPPSRRVSDISGSWVRGNPIAGRDGARVYGFVYDAGSQGGAGMNRYGEFVFP